MAISAEQAVQAAQRGLQKINDAGVAAAYLSGHSGVALLVKRLDESNRDYYLVPWETKRGIILVANVDALSGEMSSAGLLPTPLPRLVMSADDARRVVETRLNQLPIGEPALVWRPCRESASPLQPFYQLPMRSGDVYVGVDGEVYRALTPFGMGG